MLYDTILVPYDGSNSAKAALSEAVRYAKDDPGATLRIVQIIDVERRIVERLEAEGRRSVEDFEPVKLHAHYDDAIAEADAALHEQIDDALNGLMNEIVIEFLEETVPGEQIVAYADEHGCDLIIMGSRGLGALRGILGSVSSHVLRQARVPVLIVKQGSDR